MSASDGSVSGTQKIVDHGPDSLRYNIVILGDGYRSTEMAKYHADAQAFVDAFRATAPFGDLWCGINIHRVDVVSTDSGADDPSACGDGSAGAGTVARTYFDSTYCSDNMIRRLLACDSVRARAVAHAQVPATHVTMVIVNSSQYGGSGGEVATFSTRQRRRRDRAARNGPHGVRLRRRVRILCGLRQRRGRTRRVRGRRADRAQRHVQHQPASIKWKSVLSSLAHALPTTANANCSQCDPQRNPQAQDYVGAYEGARYMHCGCYRPSYNCRMRELGQPVLRRVPEGDPRHARAVPAGRLPGAVVERAGRVRIGLGDEHRASGRHHLRDVVHVRRGRQSVVAVDDGQPRQRRQQVRGHALQDQRSAIQCRAVRPGARGAGGRSAPVR